MIQGIDAVIVRAKNGQSCLGVVKIDEGEFTTSVRFRGVAVSVGNFKERYQAVRAIVEWFEAQVSGVSATLQEKLDAGDRLLITIDGETGKYAIVAGNKKGYVDLKLRFNTREEADAILKHIID